MVKHTQSAQRIGTLLLAATYCLVNFFSRPSWGQRNNAANTNATLVIKRMRQDGSWGHITLPNAVVTKIVWAGEKVQLKMAFTDGKGLGSPSWLTPSGTYQNYSQTSSLAIYDIITAKERSNSSLQLRFINRTTPVEAYTNAVIAYASAENGSLKMATAPFRVRKPQVEIQSTRKWNPSNIQGIWFGQHIVEADTYFGQHIIEGRKDANVVKHPGIKIGAVKKAPWLAGRIKWVQVIDRYNADAYEDTKLISTERTSVALDAGNPYPTSKARSVPDESGGNSAEVSADMKIDGVVCDLMLNDQPGFGATDATKSSLDTKFSSYVMFNATTGAISSAVTEGWYGWVPLTKVEWGGWGEAKFSGDKPEALTKNVHYEPKVSETNTVEDFPVWVTLRP